MSSVFLQVTIRDHNPSQGYHFLPENPSKLWAKAIDSEADRIKTGNLSSDECDKVIRVKPKNKFLKGQLIIIPKMIKSGDRPALKMVSALWHDTLPTLTNISIIEQKLRDENYFLEKGSIRLKLTQKEIKKSSIWHEESIHLVGRDVSKSQDVSTEGFPVKSILCAWACSPPEIRENTDLVIGGPKTSKTKRRRWHHSLSGTLTPLVSESSFISNYSDNGDYTLQELLLICDSIEQDGTWWKNLQVVFDNYGINVHMNRLSLMRHRLNLCEVGSSKKKIPTEKLRADAIRDLEILIRSGDSKAVDLFFMASTILTSKEVESLSPKRRYVVVSEMLKRFSGEALSILSGNLINLQNHEILELLKLLNLGNEEKKQTTIAALPHLMQSLLERDKSLFLSLLDLQQSNLDAQQVVHKSLLAWNSVIPTEAIPILSKYSPTKINVLRSSTAFNDLSWSPTFPGNLGGRLADVHLSFIKNTESTDWLLDFGLMLSSRGKEHKLDLQSWLSKLAKGLPNSLKMQYYFEFSKIWPSKDSPWVKLLFSIGSKAELRQLYFENDRHSMELRKNISEVELGDWLRKQQNLLARPTKETEANIGVPKRKIRHRSELFRLYVSPSKKEIFTGIAHRLQVLLVPVTLAYLVFMFVVLYNQHGYSTDYVESIPGQVPICFLVLVILATNTFFSIKRFRLLVKGANL